MKNEEVNEQQDAQVVPTDAARDTSSDSAPLQVEPVTSEPAETPTRHKHQAYEPEAKDAKESDADFEAEETNPKEGSA